ncbi:putative beta-ureidopropionase [Helianthus anomalus]
MGQKGFRDDEFNLDPENIMLMEAIWLSFQEVSRLLIGLNCGKALEPLTVVESAKDLSSQHDMIFR